MFFLKNTIQHTAKFTNAFVKGILYGGNDASANLKIRASSSATDGNIVIDSPVVSRLGTAPSAASAILQIYPELALTNIVAMNQGGTWPTTPGSAGILNCQPAVSGGTGGSATVSGLIFNPNLLTSDISIMVCVDIGPSFGSDVATADMYQFRVKAPLIGAARSWLRYRGFYNSTPYGSGLTGAMGRLTYFEVDHSTSKNASMSYNTVTGLRLGDLTTGARSSDQMFGIQMDLWDGDADGVQYPFYYGDFRQSAPTSVFYYNGSTYTDNTTEAGTAGGTAFTLLGATGDYLYIGTTSPTQFNRILFSLATLGSSPGTLTWQYSDGAAGWPTLTVNDNTSGFTLKGSNISFTPPTAWATESVNSTTRYWVRVSCSSSPSTDPTCRFIMLDLVDASPATSMDRLGHLAPYGRTRVSTQFDSTSDTTLSDIPGLSVNVVAGDTYKFESILYTTSNVAGGVKFAIAGTATATAIIYECIVQNATVTSAQTRATALATAVGGVTAVTVAYARITGTITVSASGTLTTQAAQNASNGTATSVLVGSTFTVEKIL